MATAINQSHGDLLELARAVLQTEADAILALQPRLGADFLRACEMLLGCRGRAVVLGMGKSGHIGSKLAATLASTGTPAFYVHPGEASHGDIGMITESDVVIMLSNSGETHELVDLLPIIKRLGVPLISLCGAADSTLARNASVFLDVSVDKEACPLGLAPTASTSATLAMGDALAIALLERRGFTAEDFARSHPGGSLGKRLLLRIHDLMHTADRIPLVSPETSLSDTIVETTQKGLGLAIVVNEQKQLVGVFTDGDLRRALDAHHDLDRTRVDEVMTSPGRCVQPDALAVEAAELMQRHRIHALPVADSETRVVGALNIHDLLRAGVL